MPRTYVLGIFYGTGITSFDQTLCNKALKYNGIMEVARIIAVSDYSYIRHDNLAGAY
jgi:hypothetical protein